jgi:DNA-binding NarL/FixJ family response regulator
VAQGLSDREIADQLSISEEGVKSHAKNILRTLGLQRRAQITLLAHQHGPA